MLYAANMRKVPPKTRDVNPNRFTPGLLGVLYGVVPGLEVCIRFAGIALIDLEGIAIVIGMLSGLILTVCLCYGYWYLKCGRWLRTRLGIEVTSDPHSEQSLVDFQSRLIRTSSLIGYCVIGLAHIVNIAVLSISSWLAPGVCLFVAVMVAPFIWRRRECNHGCRI